MHRELRAADVLVVGVDRLERHVAEERVVDPRLDPLHEILRVEISVHLGLVLPDKRDHLVLLATHRLRLDGRFVRRRGAEEAVRQHHDLELLRPGSGRVDHDNLALRLLADDRLLPPAMRRVFALDADPVDPRRTFLEVDGARIALVDELRPRRVRIRRLTEREIEAGRRILHCLERVDAERFRRAADDRRGVLRRRSGRRQRQPDDQPESRTTVPHHRPPPFGPAFARPDAGELRRGRRAL